MSLHLNRQCQRADAHPPPVRLVPGIGCTDQEEARKRRRPRLGPPPFAGGPYMCEPPMRQRLFAILLHGPFCARSRPARAAPGVRSIWDRGAGYSRSWPLKPAHFSRPPRVPNANSCGQPDAQAAEPLSSVTRSECRCASPRLPARCGPCGALRDRRSRRFRSAHRRQRSAGGGSGAESSSPAQRAQGSRPRR